MVNDEVSSDSLLSKLGLQDIDELLRSRRMRWYELVERSKGWISQVRNLTQAKRSCTEKIRQRLSKKGTSQTSPTFR